MDQKQLRFLGCLPLQEKMLCGPTRPYVSLPIRITVLIKSVLLLSIT